VRRRLDVYILGRGQVGGRLARQIAAARGRLARAAGVAIAIAGTAGRDGGEALVERAVRGRGARLLVDATAADGMAAVQARALAAGVSVVTCNKKPLGGPQADWDLIERAARRSGAMALSEVTVGAGLPVIKTLRDLRDTGDAIESVEGCVSGTLNFLCAALERGRPFSAALRDARRRGYTEPDPRDDLAGGDAARKAIILARTSGWRVAPGAIRVRPFVRCDRRAGLAEFLAGAAALDAPLARRFAAAARRGRRLRYVARAATGARVTVGLRSVPADGPLGRLAGPENIFVVRSRRYHRHPLVVAGPGAGPEVTAAGALADILEVARALGLGRTR
jgi:aspartokinase/homoserine dehydrogenase 1